MYVCERCGKGSTIGIDSTHRYGGGWSMRGQATRKVWKPNLHTLKIKKHGKTVTMRLCTKCARIEKAANQKVLAKQTPTPTPPATA